MKFRSATLLSIFIPFLIIFNLGCGGGGSDDKNNVSQGPSSDYMGIQVGSVKAYQGIELGSSFTVTDRVEEFSSDSGIFKTSSQYNGSPASEGTYIEIKGDSYYDRGEWNLNDELPDEPKGAADAELMLTKPITVGYENDYLGKCIGTEKISVPAGIFTAYKFHNHSSDPVENYESDLYLYIVPYLGIIKSTYSRTENGEVNIVSQDELSSYEFP